jgi:3-hydroxybutyryl-CoA dehydrogenase
MKAETICVCGAGTMGSGIAQVSATAGFPTILYDLNKGILDKARLAIEKDLQRLVDKNKITAADHSEILRRIHFTDDYETCRGDVIIEAIVENYEAKISLLNRLAAFNSGATIFATNTSSLSVSKIANKTSNAQRVIGMHFFNPAPLMKLVEVVQTENVSEETVQIIVDLATRLGKTAVVCRDSPGFIVNRVARPYYIESLKLVEDGAIDLAAIDALLEATGFRMGPFKLMDLIGNDVNYAVSCSVYEQLNKPDRLKPSHIQKEKVEKGELGKKTGKGYYRY